MFSGPATRGEESDSAKSKRMTEIRPDVSSEKLEPIYWQVAPYPISDMRLASEPAATQKHFTGGYTVPAQDTILTRNFPEVDNQLSQLDPFFRDTSLVVNFRSAFYRTEIGPTQLQSAWALGGSIVYKSGWFKDFFNVGVGYYTSSGLYKPYGQEGTRLLKTEPGSGSQHSQNVLGQAYAQFRYDIYRVKVYRQALDTPFINQHFDRMLPQLFEAYIFGTKTIQSDEKGGIDLKFNSDNPVSFLTGYVTEELDRGSTTFVPMSSVATKNTTSANRGVAFGGLQLTPHEYWGIDLWEYYGVDMFNTFYAETDFEKPLNRDGDLVAKLAFQFADQRSVGDELVGTWSSQMAGALAGVSYGGLSASFRFNHVFDGVGGARFLVGITNFGMQSPWGRYPGFTKSTVLDYNNADSSMYGLFASYDFGALTSELNGLEFATSYVIQERRDSGKGAGADQNEFDLILKYQPPFAEGLTFDIRGSWISTYNSPGASADATNDYRFIVNYTLPLL